MNAKKLKDTISGRKGVHWHKNRHKWEVTICYKRKLHYLGLYDNLDEAIKVREEAEAKYFGEYARKE